MEYLGHEVPVVTTPLPWCATSSLTPGGVVVPFGAPSDVVEALLALWEDRDRRHRLARAGREYVATSYDWTHQADAFVRAMLQFAAR